MRSKSVRCLADGPGNRRNLGQMTQQEQPTVETFALTKAYVNQAASKMGSCVPPRQFAM